MYSVYMVFEQHVRSSNGPRLSGTRQHAATPTLYIMWHVMHTLLAQTQTNFLIYSEAVIQTDIFGNIS